MSNVTKVWLWFHELLIVVITFTTTLKSYILCFIIQGNANANLSRDRGVAIKIRLNRWKSTSCV